MRIGLQVADFTWPGGPERLSRDLANIARTADEGGFEYLSVMDHLFQIGGLGPPEHEMLEGYTTLGFLAAQTKRVKLLTMITGVVYRQPGLLAKIVSTLDVLSGGRAWLGIGAAWNEQECRALGIDFPPIAERFERLEEAIQICLRMWSADETPFVGKHYHLERPLNSPQPLTRPHPPIMIGGSGEKKTLRLVAKYAQACNIFPTPELPHKLDVLREHCAREGTDYDRIHKTVIYRFGHDKNQILDDLGRFADLGIEAAIGSIPEPWNLAHLESIAAEVIPEAATLWPRPASGWDQRKPTGADARTGQPRKQA